MISLMLFFIFLLCGSFLNVVAYRLIKNISIVYPRSHCISCKHPIAWYDLIPIASWCFLRGSCRHCKERISFLYPLIECATAASLTLLYTTVPTPYVTAYFIFFSALIITIRTDLETMLISRFTTLFLIPFGLFCSSMGWLPINLLESVIGSIAGYGFLWVTAKVFLLISGKEGMGQGDLELLAFIGAFVGPLGVWATLLISTVVGSLIGITYIKIARVSNSVKIPFGPFLASAAMVYILFEPFFIRLLVPQSQ